MGLTKLHETLISAKSAVDTKGTLGPGKLSRLTNLGFGILFSEGCTGGQLKVEAIPAEHFTGEGGVLQTIDFVRANKYHQVDVPLESPAVQIRISKVIQGGTVTVTAQGS